MIKINDNSVIVSGIVPSHDNLDNKANKVNNRLVLMCKKRNIQFISHKEIVDSSKHLNESKLHLNRNGIKVFAENFLVFLKKFNRRHKRKITLPTSVNLNCERESHVLETPDRNLCRRNFTSPR